MRPRELKFRRSIEPSPPATSSGDGRCDGHVRPLREPFPTRAAEGAAVEGAAEVTPPPRGSLAAEVGPRRQESINLLALNELVVLFDRVQCASFRLKLR